MYKLSYLKVNHLYNNEQADENATSILLQCHSNNYIASLDQSDYGIFKYHLVQPTKLPA